MKSTGAGVGADAASPRRKSLLILGIIIFYAVIVSGLLYNQQKESPFSRHPVTDEEAYVKQAKGILDGTYPGQKIFYQSPLYPYFLALTFRVFGEDYNAVRFLQSIFGVLSILIIYMLGRKLFGEREGLIGAGLMALYGPLFNYQVLLLKVNPFIIFLTLFLLLGVLLTARPERWWNWIFFGVLCSFLLLLYDVMQLFLVIVPVWVLVQFRKRPWKWKAATIALYLAGAGLIVAPLIIRNKIVAGEWVISTSQGGANFFIGNNPIADGRYTVLPFVRPHPDTEEHDFRTEAEKRAGHALKPTEVSGFWFRQGFLFIRNNPGKWVSLLIKKTRYFFGNSEIPDNHGFTFDRAHFLFALYLTPLSFGLILPFGVLGIVLTRSRWRSLLFLYLFIAFFTMAIVVFFVVGRYRIPIVVALIPFAAAAISQLWDQVRKREWSPLLTAVPILLAVAFFSFLPSDASKASWSTEYFLLGNAFLKDADREYTSGSGEMAKTWARRARENLEYSLRMNPGNENARKSLNYAYEILSSGGTAEGSSQISGRGMPSGKSAGPSGTAPGLPSGVSVGTSDVFPGTRPGVPTSPPRAVSGESQGVPGPGTATGTSSIAQTGLVPSPGAPTGQASSPGRQLPPFLPPPRASDKSETLGDAIVAPPTLLNKNQYEEAVRRLKEDIAAHPDNAGSYFQLGLILASREEIRNFDEATKYLKKALEIDPELADGWNVLGNIAFIRGNLEEARSHYLRALTLVPDSPAYKNNLALTYQNLPAKQTEDPKK